MVTASRRLWVLSTLYSVIEMISDEVLIVLVHSFTHDGRVELFTNFFLREILVTCLLNRRYNATFFTVLVQMFHKCFARAIRRLLFILGVTVLCINCGLTETDTKFMVRAIIKKAFLTLG